MLDRPAGGAGRRLAAGALLLLAAACGNGGNAGPSAGAGGGSGLARPVETGGLPPPPPPPVSVAGHPFHRGMVYGIFGRGGERFHRENLTAMAALGIDSVQLVVPRAMETIRSTSLDAGDPHLTPSRQSLEQAVAEARGLEMRVFLFPIIYVRRLTEEEWRGTLAPSDPETWWTAYEEFILEEARWAAAREVEVFSVGSELCSLEGDTARWHSLIRKVRQVYPGEVTYSANWDHLDVLEFACDLDFLGMNAYFEVGRPGPGEAAAAGTRPFRAGPEGVDVLVARWEPILDDVERWQRRHGKRVVVTEIGYPSRAGATLDPWNYLGEGDADPAEQEQGYRAFMTAWSRRAWFGGAYFYMWWDDHDDGGRGYSPRQKPAAGTLRQWYTQGQP